MVVVVKRNKNELPKWGVPCSGRFLTTLNL
jgi:hypothetical protein